MTKDERLEHQRAIARIDRQMAELFVKRAQLQDELADDKVDASTGRPPARRHVPTIVGQVSELDRRRAEVALQNRGSRQRVR